MSTLLVGEFTDKLSSGIRDCFALRGFNVQSEDNGLRILECLQSNHYDLIVLETTLPGLNGIGVTRDFRKRGGDTPILLIADNHSSNELQGALDAGADSYLAKPFEVDDLTAQMRALLRRPALKGAAVLSVGHIAVDRNACTVTRAGELVQLFPLEYKLLEFLLSNANQVFSSKILLERVWGLDDSDNDSTVRSYIKTLRHKIDLPGQPSAITTVRGLGYRLDR